MHDGDGDGEDRLPAALHRIASVLRSVASRSFCSNTICLSTCKTSTQQNSNCGALRLRRPCDRFLLLASRLALGERDSLLTETNNSLLLKKNGATPKRTRAPSS
eukprot:COSAG02_NODE_6223_length_3716_cov_36.667957_3_plen_104_part_00